jgi:FKBP-type peptidyl-prolyl cis-trans isomerase
MPYAKEKPDMPSYGHHGEGEQVNPFAIFVFIIELVQGCP